MPNRTRSPSELVAATNRRVPAPMASANGRVLSTVHAPSGIGWSTGMKSGGPSTSASEQPDVRIRVPAGSSIPPSKRLAARGKNPRAIRAAMPRRLRCSRGSISGPLGNMCSSPVQVDGWCDHPASPVSAYRKGGDGPSLVKSPQAAGRAPRTRGGRGSNRAPAVVNTRERAHSEGEGGSNRAPTVASTREHRAQRGSRGSLF